jgi:hypothetical protein
MIYVKKIHLKLENDVFEDLEIIARTKKLKRDRYINDALKYYNKLEKRKILADRLAVEAELVKEDSMRVLRDFERPTEED